MSEIAKFKTSDITALATGFLIKSGEVKTAIRKAISNNPDIASALIVAGSFAIEDAMSDAEKTWLVKCYDRGKILCEGGKRPPNDVCHAVIAEAEAKQFELCTKQYSIWSNGTLYIKEDGYRRLFFLHEHCSDLDTNLDPPEWRKLADRQMWCVRVRGSVLFKGKKVVIDTTIGVNANATDGIAKIESHAERSLLKKLWKKATSISLEADDEAGNEIVSGVLVIEPTGYLPPVSTIEATASVAEEIATMIAARALQIADPKKREDFILNMNVFWQGQHATQKRIKDLDQLSHYNDYWDSITDGKNKNELRLLHDTLKKTEVLALGKNNVDELCRYINCIQVSVPEGAEANG